MLNLFDFIISSVIVTFFLSGLFKGAVRLMLGNISFVLSIIMCNALYPAAKSMMDEHIQVSIVSNIVSASVSYIISLILCSLMFAKIKTLIKPMCGGLIDKTCGAMLGLLNGALLSMALFIAASSFLAQKHINEYENLYLLARSFEQNTYPKWLQGSNSFYLMDGTLKNVLKIPYMDHLLQQISFDEILNHTTVKPQPSSESLDDQINTLFSYEKPAAK